MAPSDANGVYSLPNGYLAETGEVIQASQHNPPLEDIASSMTQRVMRSGATPMTGPLKLANGSASAPALTFNSATGTGVYKTTNGLGVAVNGSLVAEFTSAGLLKGARYIGELIPFTGTNAQGLTVLPYGQTLNRADYPDFWTFVQAEITAGNTSYNNGNGTTTFGILDMRGRTPVGWDKMGGTAAGRITAAGSGIDGTKLGSTGGEQTHILTLGEMVRHDHGGSTGLTQPGATSSASGLAGSSTYAAQGGNTTTAPQGGNGITVTTTVQNHNHAIAATGGDAPHNNMPPAFICNYLLFVGA